jgi:hypothetical protein
MNHYQNPPLAKCRKFTYRLGVTFAIVSAAVSVSQPTLADTRPRLGLTLTGPKNVPSGYPVEGISVRLINSDSVEVSASRLRLVIHDDQASELRLADIKLDVQEGNEWKPLPLEQVDGGVMAAISSAGLPHSEHHKRGGFPINKKTIKEWRLRATLAQAGHDSLVVAVSPNNGGTHLAQPASLKLEAL